MANHTSILILASALAISSAPSMSATIPVTDLDANNLVITEYLANPVAVSDADGEYFEVFNTTNHTIDLTGLIVRDDGSNQFTVSAMTIAPLAFALFSSADGTALGITPDYVYGNAMSLTNGDDEIALYRPDDTLINKVAYSDGDQFGAGIAHELATLTPATPQIILGPMLGGDFIAATEALSMGNFGSPGSAGGTRIDLASVPVPASFWMFGSALSILGWARRKLTGTASLAVKYREHEPIDRHCSGNYTGDAYAQHANTEARSAGATTNRTLQRLIHAARPGIRSAAVGQPW